MANKPKLVSLPRRATAEPEIVRDHALAEGLARLRGFNGRYGHVFLSKISPKLPTKEADLLAALQRWAATPPDPSDTSAVAEALVGAFPNTRINAAAYGAGLAAIAEDEGLSPDIVRHVCRHIRATQRSLPPLADLREAMLKEKTARRHLIFNLESYENRYADAVKDERAAAAAIVTGAAEAGIALTIDDVLDAWLGLDSCGCWFHERGGEPERTVGWVENWVFIALERAMPQARQAAELVQIIAPYERDWQAAWEARGLDNCDHTDPKREAFFSEVPEARHRFAAEIAAFAAAMGLKAED
jgi:hypothetical protein